LFSRATFVVEAHHRPVASGKTGHDEPTRGRTADTPSCVRLFGCGSGVSPRLQFEARIVRSRRGDRCYAYVAEKCAARILAGVKAQPAGERDVGLLRHLKVKSDRFPIAGALYVTREDPALHDADVGARIEFPHILAAHAGGEMIPAGLQVKALLPARVGGLIVCAEQRIVREG
jgi:hypothetical protein